MNSDVPEGAPSSSRRRFPGDLNTLGMVIGGTTLVACDTGAPAATDSRAGRSRAGAGSSAERQKAGRPRDHRSAGAGPGTCSGGMCFELVCDVPGEFPFVNHGFGHGLKGSTDS